MRRASFVVDIKRKSLSRPGETFCRFDNAAIVAEAMVRLGSDVVFVNVDYKAYGGDITELKSAVQAVRKASKTAAVVMKDIVVDEIQLGLAKEAGADYVGLDEYLQKIKDGWTDVDVIVTMPSVMGKLGPLGRVLGPRGLMPNPKTGTVTMDVGKAVSDVKGGKIDFKVDKTGIVHASIGKVSFDADKILGNANELMQTLVKLKPSSAKGAYIKSVSMSSTMSPSIPVEFKNV